jgi:hypothetical protein
VDVIDAANDTAELFLRAALAQRKPEPSAHVCEWCEEAPVSILPNGARARFCDACLPVASGAAP